MEFDVISLIQQYAVIPVALLCWLIGYALKNYVPKLPDNFIPLILGVVGIACVLWINWAFSFELLLAGVCSAALAVWAHQLGKQLSEVNDPEKDNEN